MSNETNITTRRNLVRGGAIGAAVTFTVLGLGAQKAFASKMPQSAVSYQDTPNGNKRCGNCSLFVRPHSCRSVAGVISPNGYCVLWKA